MFGKQVSSLSVYGSDCGLERRRSKSKTAALHKHPVNEARDSGTTTLSRSRIPRLFDHALAEPRYSRPIFPAAHLPLCTYYLPSPPPSLLLLTQIKSVVPVDLHPERVHPGVPLGVRVPQHLAVQVHDFLALSLRVLRHVYRKVQKGGGLAGDTVLPGGHGSWGIRSAAT